MQIRTYNADGTLAGGGTASVTNGSNIVYAQAGVDWSQALQGSWFTVVGSGVSYDVAAPPVLVGNTWHILLAANYAGATNAAAAYAIEKDFVTINGVSVPQWSFGDTEILTFQNRYNRSIAEAIGGGGGGGGSSTGVVTQSVIVAGGLVGATTIPVVFSPALAVVPLHIFAPIQVKSAPGDDNVPAVSIDSITTNGYNINLSGPAIAGHKYNCAYIPASL